MNFDLNEKKDVVVLLGAGAMGTAIVKRIAAGKKILLGDVSEATLERVAKEFTATGYDVETVRVDALDKASVRAFAEKAAGLGPVKVFIDTAGASPSQATPERIIDLDLVGTATAIEIFGEVMAEGGAGLIISSQAGHMMHIPPETEAEIAAAAPEKLKELAFVKEMGLSNSGAAYMVAKRGNHLHVQRAAATTWAQRRARINSISPGVIVTPLAYDEFNANGDNYQVMIATSPARRVGTPDEIAAVGAFLLGPDAAFITGTDLLIDGGVIAAIRAGQYQLHRG